MDETQFSERSKKGPFTSVSMDAFTRDNLQSPSKRAFRPSTWRIDPFFGVKGGAGATPVSVGYAATHPCRPRSRSVLGHSRPSPSGCHRIPHRKLRRDRTAELKEIDDAFLHSLTTQTRA